MKSRRKIPPAKSVKRSANNAGGAGACRRFTITVSRKDIAPAAALLENETGALSATEEKSGRVSVWVPLAGERKARMRVARALKAAQQRGDSGKATIESQAVAGSAWAHAWKRYYKPFQIAVGLFIVPSWNRSFPLRGAAALRLDPGMAFGTGLHPTTQLTMSLLLAHLRPGCTVIDIGCGSGILALAAAQKGARVYASDCDANAIAAAKSNFERNRLVAKAIVHRPDVPSTFPKADVLAANLTAPVIERLASQLAGKLKSSGVLITSGVVAGGKSRVLRALGRCGLSHHSTHEKDDWLAFVHCKAAGVDHQWAVK